MYVTMPESLIVFHFKGDGLSSTPSICNWSSWRRTGMERKYRWKQQRSLLNGFFCHYNMVSYKLQTGTCTLLEGTCRRVILSSLCVLAFSQLTLLCWFLLFCAFNVESQVIFIISTSIPYLIICICYVQIVRTFKCSKRKLLQVSRITIYNRLLVYWQGGSSGRPSCHEEELSQMVSLLQSLALECLSQRNQNARNILKEAGNHRAPSSCRLSLLGVCNDSGTRSDLDTLQKFVMRNEDGNMTTVHTRSSLSSRSRSGDRGSAGWTSWLYWSCRHLQITTYIWSWLSVTLILLITSST